MKRPAQLVLTLRKLALLFRRDFAVARSYRVAFAVDSLSSCLGVIVAGDREVIGTGL